MKALLDTNIVITRESNIIVNSSIGILFKWLDRARFTKCVHQVTIDEIHRHKDLELIRTLDVKLAQYELLQTSAKMHPDMQRISDAYDKDDNDLNDTLLLNELYNNRVDILITEDKAIHRKACEAHIEHKVYKINAFIESIVAEHPELIDYKVLSVRKMLIGTIDFEDSFFDSFKVDYPEFDVWLHRKANEYAYITQDSQGALKSFMLLKVEDEKELYSDITPVFPPKKRLKICSLKVVMNGERLGERYLKIIFDNALRQRVREIYVTVYDNKLENSILINLLSEWGFTKYGIKGTNGELVFLRDFTPEVNLSNPKLTYPFISRNSRFFLLPIYPVYHSELFPDSILNTESRDNFVESDPHRNSISKVYISRSYFRSLQSGDVIIVYRTGGYHKSVVTTIAVVEGVCLNIQDFDDFVAKCRKRSVFTDSQLLEHWDYKKGNRPFVVYLSYIYSFPRRINLARLIEIGVIRDIDSAPRGFEQISKEQFDTIIKETGSDQSIIVH